MVASNQNDILWTYGYVPKVKQYPKKKKKVKKSIKKKNRLYYTVNKNIEPSASEQRIITILRKLNIFYCREVSFEGFLD